MSKDLNTRDQLQKIAHLIDEELPEGWGFTLFAFPFNDPDGRLNYISKCRREDAIKIVQAWLDRQQSSPESFNAHV